MTSFLGFKPNEGEYKVMGLASYGNPEKYIKKVRELIELKNGKLLCNMEVFCWDRNGRIMFNEKLVDLLGLTPRLVDEKIEQEHMDLAASVQLRYEEILFGIIKSIGMFDQSTNLCLSGGCAYNGSANGKITKKTHINKVWIPLAPSDAGSSIGACVHYQVINNIFKSKVTKNPFLGPEYGQKDIKLALGRTRYVKFNSETSLLSYVAKKLNEGKIVGWYRGHCEFGARALGNRSILANPTIEGMQDRINKLVKKRELFRPFAPMVSYDKQSKYFDAEFDIPYMNQVVNVKKEYVNILKATTHVDNTARVQTVPRFTVMYNLLTEFEKLSGYPILLNTSFNIKDKTMVLTPKDALETFKETDIDLLIIDNYLIRKK
jgi:carbamoyltransferase